MVDIEAQIEIIRESLRNLELSDKRHESHYISEREFRKEQGKLVDTLRRIIDMQQVEIKRQADVIIDHEEMLRNRGSGLMFRFLKLEIENDSRNALIYKVTTWLALITSVFAIFKDYILK